MKRARGKMHLGFTLVEMIVVIVITGIIGGMVAIFLRAPVQSYVDSARRAEMTDIADTALRRLERDLRTAVPNSVRVPSTPSDRFEFLPTSSGGRYRVERGSGTLCTGVGSNSNGDALSFETADTCFEIIGSMMNFNAGDFIVIGSTQSDGSLPYLAVGNASSVRRAVPAASSGSAVQITSTISLPASSELDGHRFQVVPFDQMAVTYACHDLNGGVLDANGNGQGSLTRYWRYGFVALAPPAMPLPGVLSADLAKNVSACTFVYDTSNARNSLMAVTLTLTRGGESVHLYHEIHVNNIP